MSERVPKTAMAPLWVRVGVSVWLLVHLAAIIARPLSANSGLWPTEGGSGLASPPHFVQPIADRLTPTYLRALRMTHNFHFHSNEPMPETHFEAVLKDGAGAEIAKVRFPTVGGNAEVAYRELLLGNNLYDDDQVQSPPGESLPAPNTPVKTVRYWATKEQKIHRIETVAEHLVRDLPQPVYGPSEKSLIFARAYARRLCRQYNAKTCEIVRRSRSPISPNVLFVNKADIALPEDEVCSFGVYDGEK